MRIVHKHVRHKLEQVEILYAGEMQSQPLHQINPHLWQHDTGQPNQYINNNKIFRYDRDTTQKSRLIILIHPISAKIERQMYIKTANNKQALQKSNRHFPPLYFHLASMQADFLSGQDFLTIRYRSFEGRKELNNPFSDKLSLKHHPSRKKTSFSFAVCQNKTTFEPDFHTK